MSTLGKIYEINVKTRMKNIYPVVYMNDYLYVCKIYGSKDVRIFYNSNNFYLRSSAVKYSILKSKIDSLMNEKNRSDTVNVYVAYKEPACFEPFMAYTSDELKLQKITQSIETQGRAINNVDCQINDLEKKRKELSNARLTLKREKARLEEVVKAKKKTAKEG